MTASRAPIRLFGWLLALTAAAAPLAAAAVPAPPGACPGWGGPGWMEASDQRFLLMMVPHHEGAIAMADLALRRGRHPELRALAGRIVRSQSEENDRMRAWYRQWYGTEMPPLTATGFRSPGVGMGMGPMGMGYGLPAMDISLAALRGAPDFDRTFLEQMIAHHRMGVMMALHALRGTDHRELRVLQEAMVRVQSQEIRLMGSWYQRWYGG